MRCSLLLLIASTALFAAAPRDTFHWSGTMEAGQRIEIRGINGSIHAQPSSDNCVNVIAYKSGRRYDPGDIQVKVVEHDSGVTIYAVSSAELAAESGASPSDASVDFTVSVPSHVRFVARTVNGGVDAKSLQADAEAHTVNGNVWLSTEGTAQGETVNGSIVASLGRIGDALNFSTVNGGITVELPRKAGARIHAKTVHGAINTDFPLAVRTQEVGKRVEGPIGCGGPDLRITTVNGTINVRHRKRGSSS